MGGAGSVNEAPITGESVPVDKDKHAAVFAGTVVDSGALDIRTEKVGGDTTFSRIIALVEQAGSEQAPVQKLADKVAVAWIIGAYLGRGCRQCDGHRQHGGDCSRRVGAAQQRGRHRAGVFWRRFDVDGVHAAAVPQASLRTQCHADRWHTY